MGKIIGLDIDDTLTDFRLGESYIREYFGPLEKDVIGYYNLTKTYGLKPGDEDAFWDEYLPKMIVNAEISPRGKVLLDRVGECKDSKIVLISARPKEHMGITLEWLDRVRSEFTLPIDDVILLGSHDKATTIMNLDCKLYADDKKEIFQELHEVDYKGISILVPHYWSQGYYDVDYLLTEDLKFKEGM